MGNPCIARYVDPVRVGSRLPGLVYPGSGRWYAASSPPGCSRSRSPRPLLPSPASSGPASRSIRASSSHPTAPSRSTSSAARGRAGRRRSHRASRTTRSPARETLTAIERRTAPQATTAGINGDFFAFATGLPSGVLMQDGQVMSPPSAYRASAGVTSDGTLDVRRVTLSGTWQGLGGKRTLNQFNKPLEGKRHRALHAGVGADHAAEARRRVGDPVPVSGSDPEHRPPGSGRRAPHGRRCGADPARWRRSRRRRRCSCSAHGGGAGRAARDGAAQPQARLAGHRLRDRRRPADRPRRRPDLPGGRDLHDEPARRRARRGAPSASSPTAR